MVGLLSHWRIDIIRKNHQYQLIHHSILRQSFLFVVLVSSLNDFFAAVMFHLFCFSLQSLKQQAFLSVFCHLCYFRVVLNSDKLALFESYEMKYEDSRNIPPRNVCSAWQISSNLILNFMQKTDQQQSHHSIYGKIFIHRQHDKI